MIKQFILDEVTQPFSQGLSNGIAVQLLLEQQCPNFAIDSKRTRNKICSKELLIKPQDLQKNNQAYLIYIDNYFKGIKHTDYTHSIRRRGIYQQKLQSVQEIDNKKQQKKNIFQEKEQPIIKIDETIQSECHNCSSQAQGKYFEVDRKILCDDCATREFPDIVTKLKLKQILKNKSSKGEKYQEKLRNFYEQTLKEVKLQNQVVLPNNIGAND